MTNPTHPDLHPDCELFAPLLGTWRGRGEGAYPSIESFAYDEVLRFGTTGARFVVFEQRTTDPSTGAPQHAESGFWRPVLPDRVEVVIAHPTGLGEVEEGTVDGGHIELRSTAVAHATTAKRVDIIERTFRVNGDVLRYTVRMAAMGYPLTDHLVAELTRDAP